MLKPRGDPPHAIRHEPVLFDENVLCDLSSKPIAEA
jgi:hypothetical protein